MKFPTQNIFDRWDWNPRFSNWSYRIVAHLPVRLCEPFRFTARRCNKRITFSSSKLLVLHRIFLEDGLAKFGSCSKNLKRNTLLKISNEKLSENWRRVLGTVKIEEKLKLINVWKALGLKIVLIIELISKHSFTKANT